MKDENEIEDDLGFLDDGIMGYVASEEELQEQVDNMSLEDIPQYVDSISDNVVDNIQKNNEQTKENTSSITTKNSPAVLEENQEQVKKTLKEKFVGFVDDAVKFGFTYTAAFYVLFAIISVSSNNIKSIIDNIKNTKENLKDFSETCDNVADRISQFEKFKEEQIKELDEFKNNSIQYVYEAEKQERLYKSELINMEDTRYDEMKMKAEELANKIYKNNPSQAEKYKNTLVAQGYSIVNQKLIEKGYDISHEGTKEINGKVVEIPANAIIVSESKETYNTRIKQLEEEGLLHDNSLEEEEMEIAKT